MIDVHIIQDSTRPKEWFDVAVNSIPTTICNVHIINKRNRSIAENRYEGFISGDSEYISFVDDDDYALPGAFEKCLETLENNKELAGTGTLESVIRNGEIISPSDYDIERMQNILNDADRSWNQWKIMHHLVILRRSSIEPYLYNLNGKYPEIALYKSLYEAGLKTKVLPFSGYVWRQHDNNYHTNKNHKI